MVEFFTIASTLFTPHFLLKKFCPKEIFSTFAPTSDQPLTKRVYVALIQTINF